MRKIVKSCRRPNCLACELQAGPASDHSRWVNEYHQGLTVRSYNGMAISKPAGAASVSGSSVGARQGDDWVLYPYLMEFLVEAVYEDGSARELPTLLLFAEGGSWKGCLNDRDNDRNAFVASASLTGLLAVIDAKLKESSLEWRAKGAKGKKGK